MSLFLLTALAATAAQGPAAQPLATAQGAFFALSVPDAEAAAKWYADKLGLKIILRPPPQADGRLVAMGGGGLIVELIERRDAAPMRMIAPQVKHDTMVHGIFKAGVIIGDWDGLVAGLKARGVPIAIGPFPASAEQRANLIIRDNNGNYIQFFDSRPSPAENAKP